MRFFRRCTFRSRHAMVGGFRYSDANWFRSDFTISGLSCCGVAEGLRQTMVDYIAAAKEDYLAHPRFWAAFIIAGDGAVRTTRRRGRE